MKTSITRQVVREVMAFYKDTGLDLYVDKVKDGKSVKVVGWTKEKYEECARRLLAYGIHSYIYSFEQSMYYKTTTVWRMRTSEA